MLCSLTMFAVIVVIPALAFKYESAKPQNDLKNLSGTVSNFISSKRSATVTLDFCIPSGGCDSDHLCTQAHLNENNQALLISACTALVNCRWDSTHTFCRPNHRCTSLTTEHDCVAANGGYCTWWDTGEVFPRTLSHDKMCIPWPAPDCHQQSGQPACDQYVNCAWNMHALDSEPSCKPNMRCLQYESHATCVSNEACRWWDASIEPAHATG